MGQKSTNIPSAETNINTGLNRGTGMTGVGSPITNEAYNVIAALHSKLEGLEAYRKYSKDGDPVVWQQLTQAEVQGVELLVNELERLVNQGQFKLRQPGNA